MNLILTLLFCTSFLSGLVLLYGLLLVAKRADAEQCRAFRQHLQSKGEQR